MTITLADEIATLEKQIEALRQTLERLRRPSVDDTAPIARLHILDGDISEANLYAPGLPDGEHDVWPCPVAGPTGVEAWAICADGLAIPGYIFGSRGIAECSSGWRALKRRPGYTLRRVTITVEDAS